MQKKLRFLPWLVILIFGLYKIQDLSLPYFWDEAWSYFPALEAMQKSGPSLLPGAIHPDLYRGHPLLFYFLSSAWMNIAPDNSIWAKVLPLLISLFLLFFTYQFARKHFNVQTAQLATVLLSIQSVFIAQASFLLPEILLSLFTILALNAFLTQHKWQTVLWVTCALYTKESALVLGLSLMAWQFTLDFYTANKRILLKNIISSFYLTVPFAFIGVFFILQKIWIGWVFFPEHLGYISLSAFANKAEMYLGYLLIFRGRNLLTAATLIAIILILIKNPIALKTAKNPLIGLSFFVLSYLAFSSLNFYSPRYLLSVFPLLLIMISYLLISAFAKFKWAFYLLLLLLIGNNAYYSFFRFEPNDHTLGYRDMIAVHQEIIATAETEFPTHAKIATHFLMKANLQMPSIGYLKTKNAYTQVSLVPDTNTQFVLISNIEPDPKLQLFLDQHLTQLIKKAEQNGCWSALYKIK